MEPPHSSLSFPHLSRTHPLCSLPTHPPSLSPHKKKRRRPGSAPPSSLLGTSLPPPSSTRVFLLPPRHGWRHAGLSSLLGVDGAHRSPSCNNQSTPKPSAAGVARTRTPPRTTTAALRLSLRGLDPSRPRLVAAPLSYFPLNTDGEPSCPAMFPAVVNAL